MSLPSEAIPLVQLEGLRKHFPGRRSLLGRARTWIQAVDGIDLAIARGTTTGLVGESGSGKSTTARLLLRLIEADAGRILLDGQDLRELSAGALREARRRMQMIFQDPLSSLNPSMRIAEAVAEPLVVHTGLGRDERRQRVGDLLERVGLGAHHLDRYPDELSGGQRQRAAIARALTVEPELIVCDEAVSALDVSVQAQVVNLLRDLQRELGVTYLFIAHDLAIVHHVADRVAVMYLGRIVEEGPAEDVWRAPLHPYTESLLSASPVADPDAQAHRKRIVLPGDVPSPADPPSGCRLHTRCPYVMDVCREVDPPLQRPGARWSVACHLHDAGPALSGRSVRDLPVPHTV